MKYSTYYVNLIENGKGKRWQARAKYKDERGKWKEVSKILTDATGKREANKMAKEWFDKINEEADLMPNVSKAKTVDETFMEYLNHQLATDEIEKTTYRNTMYSYKAYIKPYLGDYIFASVDKNIINSWLTKLYKLGLSQNTIHTTYARLKKVYSYFFNSGELLRDPFKGVKMPKKGDPKITHLTFEQMDDILSAVYLDYEPKDKMFVGILLALYAGLRRGEICGLRWNDLDFQRETITIRSAIGVASGDDNPYYTKNPKNKSSNRTFPMLPQLEDALLQRREAIKPKGNWFVVGDKEKFLRPTHYNRLFSEFVERNNLVDAYGEKIVPHSLRHNFATVGIRAGMDIASLALMMGHASRAMTLDTYGDANADALKVSSIKLQQTFNENSIFYEMENELEELMEKEEQEDKRE
ncbi:MAG: site-specific integrase [Bacilli bacterium]|nr:site-specific integrase [Bacilli bacterium]